MLNFSEILLFAVTFLGITILTRSLWKKKTGNRRYPPSLPTLPIVGSLPFIRNVTNVHQFFMGKADEIGPIFTFKAGSKLVLILSNTEVIHEAFVKNSTCYAGRDLFYVEKANNAEGRGIVAMNFSSEFKHYHKLTLSVLREFGFGTSRLMETRILEEVQAISDYIRTKKGKGFDPVDMIALATYNVIKNIVLAKRQDYEKGPDDIITAIMSFFHNATFAIDVAPALLKRIPYFSRKLELCKRALTRQHDLLKEEIENIKKDGSVECFVASYIAKEGPDYDQEQLIFTVRDLMGAGSDTTASTLQWLLIFVANDPARQDRLLKDIDKVISRDRLPSLADQTNLPFVEATILETMRIRTIAVLGAPRVTLSDSEVSGYFIPEGTKVLPNIYAVHMDPKVWKDPEVFRPERFLDNENNVIRRDGILPFSSGRRSCLGEILARHEIFLFFVGLVQRFNFRPGENEQKINDDPVVDISTKPNPFKIRLIPRDTN